MSIRRIRIAAQRIIPPAWLIFMFSISGLFLRRFLGATEAAWLGVLVLISVAITALVVRSDRARPAALLPVVALTVTGGIATLFGTDPLMGTTYLVMWIVMVLIWWEATLMPVSMMERATFAVLATFSLLGIFESLVWAMVHGGGYAGLITRPMVSFPSTNHLGAGLIAAMVLAIKQKRWLWLAIMAITLGLTGSRGAVLGAVAGAALYVFWMIRERRVVLSRWLIISGGIVVGVTVLLFAIQWQNGTHALPVYRLDLWQAAAHTFADHPITGIGLENYRYGFLEHAQITHERIHEQAHSVVLQIAAEQGVIGLAALGLLILVVARTLIELHRRGDRERLILASVFFAAMAVQGIFDHVYEAVINVLVVLLASWALMRAPVIASRPHPKRSQQIRFAILLVGLFIVALVMARITPVWPHLLMPFAAVVMYFALGRDPLP